MELELGVLLRGCLALIEPVQCGQDDLLYFSKALPRLFFIVGIGRTGRLQVTVQIEHFNHAPGLWRPRIKVEAVK